MTCSFMHLGLGVFGKPVFQIGFNRFTDLRLLVLKPVFLIVHTDFPLPLAKMHERAGHAEWYSYCHV